MLRSKKQTIIDKVLSLYDKGNIVLARYKGLTVSDLTSLRKSLIISNSGFMVVKNSLSKIAAKSIDSDTIVNMFKGQVGIAYSSDPISMCQSLVTFAKSRDNFEILGGLIDHKLYSSSFIEYLTHLPALSSVNHELLSLVQSPIGKMLTNFNYPSQGCCATLHAYASK